MEHSEPSCEHRVFYPQYNEHRYCTALRSIDTVRSLHQTVVSLRSALDESRQEIEKLRKQIIINNEIQDARPCQHPEAAIQSIDFKTLGDKVSELEKIYYKTHPKGDAAKEVTFADEAAKSSEEPVKKSRSDAKSAYALVPNISISTQNLNENHSATGGGSTNNQMASRIDVKIKVSSNINVNDGNDSSTEASTERSDSPAQQSETDAKDEDDKPKASRPDNPKVEVEMYEDSNTNTFLVDGKNVKIKVTSEDNVNITKSTDGISIHQSSSEYLNLDIDDMSEGENSVFTEGATTPIEQRMQQVEDIGSENEAMVDEDGELPREEQEDNENLPEDEVDDIELIFSSDDNKDVIQEDLVSLSEYEPWQEGGDAGTPILMKFSTLTSEDRDREAYYTQKKALKAARVAKAAELKSQSVDSHRSRDKSLESTDSLSFDNHAGCNVESSMDRESSLDNTISRDASFDTNGGQLSKASGALNKKWTNVNVLIETDISKVGIGDENILDMGRRNTCPNPPLYRSVFVPPRSAVGLHKLFSFQFHRPLGHRSSFRSPLASRYPRSPRNHCPLMATKSLRGTETEASAVTRNGDKCSSAAQTDISALPVHHQWRSETQLIGADYCLGGFTLPSKHVAPRSQTRTGKSSLR